MKTLKFASRLSIAVGLLAASYFVAAQNTTTPGNSPLQESPGPAQGNTSPAAGAQKKTTSKGAAVTQKKLIKPVKKFIPTEKLRADDTVAFPVDI